MRFYFSEPTSLPAESFLWGSCFPWLLLSWVFPGCFPCCSLVYVGLLFSSYDPTTSTPRPARCLSPSPHAPPPPSHPSAQAKSSIFRVVHLQVSHLPNHHPSLSSPSGSSISNAVCYYPSHPYPSCHPSPKKSPIISGVIHLQVLIC
jgi:hypothetical protein